MEIERNIRIFFARYGRLLLFTIGVIFLIITFIQTANRIAVENKKSREVSLTEEEQKLLLEGKTKEEKEKKVIEKWIEYCRNNQLDEAYKMLSEASKKKYETVEKFGEEFIKDKFLIKVISYTVYRENNAYSVKMQQDFLETGSQNTYVFIKLNVDEEILGDKIEVLN